VRGGGAASAERAADCKVGRRGAPSVPSFSRREESMENACHPIIYVRGQAMTIGVRVPDQRYEISGKVRLVVSAWNA
jgi:hypothetical protein